MKPILSLFIIQFGFFVLAAQAQVSQPPIKSAPQEAQLPSLKDWFLSSGDWHNDAQLYVREYGKGAETIIMLHGGWGGEHSGMMELVEDLADQYRFVFYDQRGSLRSPFPDSLITFEHHIEDLELLRKELKLEKVTIVGHSMGAVLASAYASKYPHRIKRLTLLAPAYLKNSIPEEDMPIYKQQQESLQQFLNRPEVMQELDKYTLNRESPPLSSREETSKFRINFGKRMLYDIRNWSHLTGGRAIYQGHVFQLTAQTYPESGWDYVETFKKGAYPVSIIIGDHDFLDFGNHLIKKWAKGIPNIKLSVVKNAGHIIWIDQPELFARELKKHLK